MRLRQLAAIGIALVGGVAIFAAVGLFWAAAAVQSGSIDDMDGTDSLWTTIALGMAASAVALLWGARRLWMSRRRVRLK